MSDAPRVPSDFLRVPGELIGRQIGAYQVTSLLGAGGMGEVYRARDNRLARDVAIKVLPAATFMDPTARARLLREAQAAAALNHPHICAVHDVGEAGGRVYITMELIAGQTLDHVIPEDGMPADEMARYALQIADAVGHAHERGVVHRDLKPGNILVTPEGWIKVLDFGLAKRAGGEELPGATSAAPESLTEIGTLAGTLPYMAPEQLRGERADVRSDVWALGVVLYEMAAGVRPFQGRTGPELSSAILHQPPAALPETVPLGLRTVIDRCVEKEPERRYQRAGEVHAALEAIQIGAAPQPVSQRDRLNRRGWPAFARPGLTLAAVAAGAATLSVGWWVANKPASSVPRVESLVVLPVEDVSETPAQEYVFAGMHHGVISGLTRIAALRVIAPLSAKYAGTEESASTIAKRFGVDAIVRTAMRTAGDRVQLHVQLIRGSPEQVLWGHTYDGAVDDLLDLQSQLARGIVEATQVTVTPDEASRLATVRAVAPNAQEAYLKAAFFLRKLTPDGHAQAFHYLQEALAADSTWAAPYALLAEWHIASTYAESPPTEAMLKAKDAVARGLELDSAFAEAHVALGQIRKTYDWDWAGAEQAFKRALALKPGLADAHTQYATHLSIMGRHDEAVREAKLGVELDPLSNAARGQLSMVLDRAGWHHDAIEQARETIALDPTFGVGYGRLIFALIGAGRTEEAVAVFESRRKVGGSGWLANAGGAGGGAVLYALSGRRQEARRLLNEILDHASDRYVIPGVVAGIYAALGETEEAMRWLQRAYDARDINLPYHLALRTMDPIRMDPRFQALVHRMKLPHLAKSDRSGRPQK